jgi:hypothetical protein
MGGNKSTGMRATLVIPMTVNTRQITIMKYGLRMENPDIGYLALPSFSAAYS